MAKIQKVHPTKIYFNDNVQIEARCSECDRLLFAYQVQSHAVIELVCPRCFAAQHIEIYPDDTMTLESEMIRKRGVSTKF